MYGIISFFSLPKQAAALTQEIRNTGERAFRSVCNRFIPHLPFLYFRSHKFELDDADIDFQFPTRESLNTPGTFRLNFMWRPASMSQLRFPDSTNELPELGILRKQLLMFAVTHHQSRMRTIIGSSNAIQSIGCTPTLHGRACPVRDLQFNF
jgi:hypothetical protein